MADVRIVCHGTVWEFTPLNADATRYFKTHFLTEEWQWMGKSLVVEHRPALEVRSILVDEGFSLQ